MFRISVRRVIYAILTLYLVCSLWVVYVYLIEQSTSSKESSTSKKTIDEKVNDKPNTDNHRVINVWGKAAIAEYLWLHILEGKLTSVPGYLLQKGSVTIEKIKLSYTTGPSLIVETADKKVSDLIIILNGREPAKVRFAKSWLDGLVNQNKFYDLRNLGVLLLGNEACNNDWLLEYVDKFPNLIKFVFIVYDINDDSTRPVYQWPLGVATYRHFPLLTKTDINIQSERKYKCNFLGTVYANSSRETLMKLLGDNDYKCFTKVRFSWKPKETKESMSLYHDILKNSDLTLCPVGINSESYRIYEALSYGSVPVLEDVMTEGQCGKDSSEKTPPYSLLKKHKAPVIFVKNWNELPALLQLEDSLSPREKYKRREKVVEWYEVFRYLMREELLRVTLSNFN